MPTLTLHDLSEETLSALERLASQHGHSVEDETRRLLDEAVQSKIGPGTALARIGRGWVEWMSWSCACSGKRRQSRRPRSNNRPRPPLKPDRSAAVLTWLDAQLVGSLFLTTISWAEPLSGVAALPLGRRRTDLHRALTQQVRPLFEDRVLDFDTAAKAAGNPIGFADGAIAAIAAARGFTIATRNVRDFHGTGVRVVNPWG